MQEYLELFARWVARLRQEEPRAVAILCHGSYARGAAEPFSDLDLNVLIDGEPEAGYRSAFEQLPDGRLLHATIATMSLNEWLAQFDEPGESEEWAFFLPAQQAAQVVWATPEAAVALEGRITLELATAPQLQDLLESAAKVRNALARHDALGVRQSAQDVALRVPALLALLTPVAPVHTRREALQAALHLPIPLPHYRDDLLACLGMHERSLPAAELAAVALRLTVGVLELLRASPDVLTDLVEPGLPEGLDDGSLLRLLTE
jgi:phosphoribosyl-AMP cyclohydrolase